MKLDLVKATSGILMAAACASAAPAAPAVGKLELGEVVKDLADESFVVRQAATRELWKLGEKAVPELQLIVDGDDPEAAVRARDLLRKIELGILPDSSPRLVELVMRYDRGGVDERRAAINEMKRLRAWRQILKLHALETDKDSLEMLEFTTRGVTIAAAREAISANPPDIRGAFAYLGMSRPEPLEYMAMAALHRATGTLDEELKKARDPKTEKEYLWRYALLSVAGRLDEAADAAAKAGLNLTSARLQLLAGDPVPWLKTAQPAGQTIPALGLATYREIAINAWQGQPAKPEELRQLRRFVRGGEDEERAKDLRLLFLAGEHEEGEKLLANLDPLAAFYYFESAERIDEALRVFDIDPEKPDFTGWAAKRFRVIIDEPDKEDRELSELSLLGAFLEQRGLHEELDAAFAGPLVELAGKDQENFVRVSSRLFEGALDGVSTPTVRPVIRAIADFAGDDDVRWMLMVGNLLGRQEHPDELWSWLATLDPVLDRAGRMERLCRIHGMLPDPDDERGKFFEQAWQVVEAAEKDERGAKVEVLLELARATNDSKNFLRALEMIETEEVKVDKSRLWEVDSHATLLSALGRWDEAAAEWLQLAERYPTAPHYHALAAAALRRNGDETAALDQEHQAELLALGETATQYECAMAFAAAGDFDRAAKWWMRAATECTRETSNFYVTVVRLADEAMAAGNWKLAAALSEAQAFRQALSGAVSYRTPVTFGLSQSTRYRNEADFSRAFDRLETEREKSLRTMERVAAMPFSDLSLADHFFEPMREAGLVKIHDQAFQRHWDHLEKIIARFPGGDNTRNSIAWLASRANRRTDEAAVHLERALANHPRQAAYLDTMAELHFARGDREKAVELSNRSLAEMPGDLQLVRQNQRFTSGPFPPK